MSEKLVFTKIKRENIFCDDFYDFKDNNEIEFSRDKIAILYGPNGIGKTSLAKVLSNDKTSEFTVEFNNHIYNEKNNNLFHIINDQNGRNIIKGTTEDFLLGDNIKKEHELRDHIDSEFDEIFKKNLIISLKTEFNISKKTDNLIKKISNDTLRAFVKDLANNKSKGDDIKDDFLSKIKLLKGKELVEYDQDKFKFLVEDFESKKSIISKIMMINNNLITKNIKVKEIEENNEAIKILERFNYKKECIVCDNIIQPEDLLSNKKENRKKVIESLDPKTKNILKDIVEIIGEVDPFNIKETLLQAIENGDKSLVDNLDNEFNKYLDIFNIRINNLFVHCLDKSDLNESYEKYTAMISDKPEMTYDDMLFIEKIVNENIDKHITLARDKDHNLKLLLGETEFINKDRDELHLSTGEQNFISLSFEFLKAKKLDTQIVVLDDPISSFDSIYKNKIAYAILKFLENKNQIILTHNTDLIRLLECQKNNCFNLYLFNNGEKKNNGFIRVSPEEQHILLYLDKLLNLFRYDIFDEIKDEKNYLISMIPFMRGYAQIIDDKDSKNKLTQLMHGYEKDIVDITEVYNTLFSKDKNIKNIYKISVKDIVYMNTDSMEILKPEKYPLLNKTLKHTLTYLYLRLNVEKTLVDKYHINTNHCDLLGQIINKAFGRKDENKNKKIFLTSKKTLLNEFNHFEGNMNIFQPAIDISDTVLEKEKKDILEFLNNLKTESNAV